MSASSVRPTRKERIRATGDLLSALLLDRDGPYFTRWSPKVIRTRSDEDQVGYAAVAKVLVEYAWKAGELDERTSFRSQKERVRLALNGERLSAPTLTWFIAAFSMSQADASALTRAYSGQQGPHPATSAVSAPTADPHRTLRCIERHVVGSDRRPRRHNTVQRIQATADGYSVYPYLFDTEHAVVIVTRGGSAGPVRPAGEGLWAVDIELAVPLSAGDRVDVAYETQFHYDTLPPPEFLRGVRDTSLTDLDMAVQFDSAAVPDSIVWVVSRSDDRQEVLREEVELDGDLSVRRKVNRLSAAFAGFTWTWPD